MDPMEKKSLQKMPPHDDDAELAVLSSILIDNPMLNEVIPISPPEMFYKASGKKVLTAMQTMSERGEPIDLVTLKAQLVMDGTLQDVGGESFLCRIADELPSGANAIYYANIVREKHIARQMLNMSMELASKCYAEREPSEDLINFAQDKMLVVNTASSNGSFSKIGPLAKQTYTTFQAWSQKDGGIIGVPSGYYDLDRMTGGFMPGDLITVAGRPAMGKTTVALNMARYIAIHLGIPAAFFSAEMPEDQLSNRLVCTDAMVSQQDIRENNLSQDDWDHLAKASEVMSHAPLFIYDHVPLSAARMVPLCKGLKLQQDLGIIIVDYLQLMDSGDEYLDQKSNMTAKVSGISKRLKNLAKQIHVPVVMVSQLNRKLEDRSDKRPMPADLRDSGSIEQDSDIIIFVYRPEVYYENAIPGQTELIISKHRNGPTGTVYLNFQKEFTKFVNIDTKHSSNPFTTEVDEKNHV
jgi:replicative DNA helicase